MARSCFKSLGRYWPKTFHYKGIASTKPPYRERGTTTPKVISLQLPMWASDLGIKGPSVPCWAFKDASGLWDKVDWIAVAFGTWRTLPREHTRIDMALFLI